MIAAIDFGASATKAAVLEPGGPARPVLFDKAQESSSAVFLNRNGRLITGLSALNSARRRPHMLQSALKRRINRPDEIEPVHQEVFFDGGVRLPLVRCVGTVIAHAWQAILEQTDGKGAGMPLLLTHPVGWSGPQRAALLEAARLAGVRPAGMLSEAEAVGWHVAEAVRPASSLLVVDLGASTLDLAVLDLSSPDRIAVRYTDGDNYLGGDDFDREILAMVQADLSVDPRDSAQLAEFVELCDTLPFDASAEAELVKRTTAEEGTAAFAYGDIRVDVDCEDFYKATAHLVDRIGARVRRAIGAGTEPPETMVVSGGAARLPTIREKLAEVAQEAGVAYLDWDEAGLPGDATTAVALGAARVPQPWSGADARGRRPVTLEGSALFAGTAPMVAVPGGPVVVVPVRGVFSPAAEEPVEVFRRTESGPDDRLLVRPRGVACLGYDPTTHRLVTAAPDHTVSLWKLDDRRPLLSDGAYWRGPGPGDPRAPSVVAVAARGRRAAFANSDGTVVFADDDWRPFHPGFQIRRLTFVTSHHLLAVGADDAALIDVRTRQTTDVLSVSSPDPHGRALIADAGHVSLVIASSGKGVRCFDCSAGAFTERWAQDAAEVSALAVIRLDGSPIAVVFDAKARVYRALDARTGIQIALKDASGSTDPVELLSDSTTGVLYARDDRGWLSILTFGQVQS